MTYATTYALYQNTFFGASNPASMVWNGDKYGVALGLFNPNRDYTVTGNPSGFPGTFGLVPGKVESDSKLFPMPSVVGNWMINETSSFGISLYGNGGMNTNYPTATFHGSNPTGVNLMQMFGAFTYSFKLGENWSMGISAILAWQSFEAKGLEAFGAAHMSSDAQKLTNNGASSSFGYGAKIGLQGEITDGLFLGATFQTKMKMGKFTEYAGLFAEAGGFDIPMNWTVGIAYELIPEELIIAVDFKQIYYNKVKSIANRMMHSTGFNGPLGSDTGAGFGWQDMSIWKFGLEYVLDDEWKLRTGFSTGKNPVRSSEVMFNILAPGVIDNHITFGFSKLMGDSELNVAIVRALRKTVSGPNPMEAPNQQTIDLSMAQWELEIGITF